MPDEYDKRGSYLGGFVLLIVAGVLGVSGFFGARESWLSQNVKYSQANRLTEPPIVGDRNNDGIDDVLLRYMDGREQEWRGYVSEEGDVKYRLNVEL